MEEGDREREHQLSRATEGNADTTNVYVNLQLQTHLLKLTKE